MSDATNPVTAWGQGYQRVTALAADVGDRGLVVTVPACPQWSARDLIAHMIGVGTDALTGDVPDDNNPGWTQHHIGQRPGTLGELLTEWAAVADAIEEFVRTKDSAPVVDLLVHEQDLRGALGVPGGRDADGQDIVREALLGILADNLRDQPSLALQATDSDWTWQSTPGTPVVVISAGLFDLTRALSSRRTADQLRAWTTTGSVEPYLDAFATVGPLPDHPLDE